MKLKTATNSLILALAAFIWGVAFVAQSAGMDYIGPFTFNSIRTILGGIVLLPVIVLLDAIKKKNAAKNGAIAEPPAKKKSVWVGGILCGIILFAASSMQQIGIMINDSAGKSGFITALYIIIVPIIGLIFKKKAPFTVWIAALLAVFGMYMLCINEQFTVNTGDVLILICAVLFSVHILVIDAYSPYVDGVRMSCIQFFVAGIIAIPFTLLDKYIDPKYAGQNIQNILDCWLPILYAGVMSCGAAYTLQIVGQKNVPPTLASMVLSLESVFAVLAGWVLLGQKLSARELIGCAIVFVAIILAQIPLPVKKNKAGSAGEDNENELIKEENEVKQNG